MFRLSLWSMAYGCISVYHQNWVFTFSYVDFYYIFSHMDFSLFKFIVITDPFRFISATLFCTTKLFLTCVFIFIMKHLKLYKKKTLIWGIFQFIKS